MVLEALTAPKGVSSTPNARRDDCVLTRRCLQGDCPFSARGPHRAPGEDTLLLDMTELQDPKPAADRIRFAEDLVESLIGTVAETVPSGGDVALLGGEALAWRW